MNTLASSVAHASLKMGRGFVLFVSLSLLMTCSDEEVEMAARSYPSIDTYEVADVTPEGAYLFGKILSLGTEPVLDHGFVYTENKDIEPSLQNANKISLGPSTMAGEYTALANQNMIRDKTYYVRAYASTKELTSYGQTVSFLSRGGTPPKITQILPQAAVAGDTVLIIGTGFNTNVVYLKLTFGSIDVYELKADNDTIRCIVPVTTATGESEVTLKVGQTTTTAANKFTLLPLSIDSLGSSHVTFGDTLTVYGKNFSWRKDLMVPSAFGYSILNTELTRTKISFIIPSDMDVPRSIVSIKLGNQTVVAEDSVHLFKPVIDSLSIHKATSGNEVIIYGKHFSPIVAKNKVEFVDRELPVLQRTRTSLSVTIPSGIAPGTYPFSVTVATQNVVSTSKLEIIRPLITGIAPTHTVWNEVVTISGENFSPVLSENIVKFGDVEATVISATPTEIKVRVPASLSVLNSTISIQVLSVDGLTASSATPFTVDLPEILTFTPAHGIRGDVITISGNNFNPVASDNVVKFGDADAVVVTASSTEIKVKVPATLATESSTISVTWTSVNGLAGFASDPFTLDLPVIFGFTPAHGIWGDIVTINGSSFTPALTDNAVKFGDALAPIMSITATEIKVQVPAALITASAPLSVGWVDGLFTEADLPFELDVPVIFATNPTEGKPGSEVIIEGKNFSSVPAENIIKFGDSTVEVIAASANQLTVRLPSTFADSEVMVTVNQPPYLGSAPGTFHMISPWRRIANIPGNARTDGAAFVLSGSGYVVFGIEGGNSTIKSMWRYSPALDQWNAAASLQTSSAYPYRYQMAFTAGDTAYIGFGAISKNLFESVPNTTLWKYVASENNWYPGPYPTRSTKVGATSFEAGGKGYIIGGSATKETLEFDPTTATWTQKAVPPSPSAQNGSGFVINSLGYLIDDAKEVLRYDVVNDQWARLNDFPGNGSYNISAFAIDGDGYLLGGSSGSELTKEAWKYSAQTDSWTQLPSFPGNARLGAVTFVIEGKAYYGTGMGFQFVRYSDFWEFDPSKL